MTLKFCGTKTGINEQNKLALCFSLPVYLTIAIRACDIDPPMSMLLRRFLTNVFSCVHLVLSEDDGNTSARSMYGHAVNEKKESKTNSIVLLEACALGAIHFT